MMDVVTVRFADQLKQIGLEKDTCLIIDESGNPKKGRHSAAVKRQYCGQTGKIDNCQVGVFGALCGGSLVNLVQARLSGTSDSGSKIDQASEVIDHITNELNVSVTWVCFDAFYGRDSSLLAGLIKRGLHFVADVPDNTSIYMEAFQMRIPVHVTGKRGRRHVIAKPNRESISIRQYAGTIKEKDWKYIAIRHQSGNRKLKAWFHSREIYILNPITQRKQLLTLLIRADSDGTIKYSLCHCPGCSIKELAYRQSKRYFVEKAFREGKKELGLNEYQTRSEEGWHKHMAMVMLAQLFLNDEKTHHFEHSKLWLTTQDVLHTLKNAFGFVKKTLEDFLNDLILKQPPDKRLLTKQMYLRI